MGMIWRISAWRAYRVCFSINLSHFFLFFSSTLRKKIDSKKEGEHRLPIVVGTISKFLHIIYISFRSSSSLLFDLEKRKRIRSKGIDQRIWIETKKLTGEKSKIVVSFRSIDSQFYFIPIRFPRFDISLED